MDLQKIEKKWQEAWSSAHLFESDPVPGKKKYFVNFPYPYMNGYLHIGHAFSLMRLDILSRYKRLNGYNVLFPFAFHCTGTPIVAAANRIKKSEEKQKKILKDMGIPEKEIPKFSDPLHWTSYFPKEGRKDLERLGVAVDWRRTFITTTLNPYYSKFIEWQFLRLKEEGLVKKGEFPVIWCPNCKSVTGDHARLKGEGERPQEFTLLKFRTKLKDFNEKYRENIFLLAATLRPETVFGQTNLWVDPEEEYAVAEFRPDFPGENKDGKKKTDKNENNESGEKKSGKEAKETEDRKFEELQDIKNKKSNTQTIEDPMELWLLSKPAVAKLKNQKKNLKIIGNITGKELIGNHARAPAINKKIPILPSQFCDPEKGTGIVTSVPSDAPDDWMGLLDLQRNPEECEKYGLDPEKIAEIQPVSIIDSGNMGTTPAVDICKKMGIKNQNDRERLIKAKQEIYKLGYYNGVMADSCGKFSGKPVEWVKDEIKKMLLKENEADLMYELAEEVVCRCLTHCTVKIVDNQWFLNYSDQEWKKETHSAVDKMELFPETVRKQFDYVVDWLNDWACTRAFGLGTPLPWDDKWLIESLSDSTVYMAYYTISKYLENDNTGYAVEPEKLDYDFFDYIFRGNGDIENISENSGVTPDFLAEMRKEFLYWYPYEIRGSGKDLIQNHLTFSVFNHVAVFDKGFAPKGFTVNGWLRVDGEKMSKSAGNFYTLRDVLDIYGTDVVRLTLGGAGEGLEDPNWEVDFADTCEKRIVQWMDFVKKNYKRENKLKNGKLTTIHLWFRSKMHRLLMETREQMELINFRSALKSGYFEMQNILKHYLKRTHNNPNQSLVNEFMEIQTIILSPFIPHAAEEVWESIGKQGYIQDAKYPEPNEKFISSEIEEQEDFLKSIIDDIRKILKVTKIRQKKIVLYTSVDWKYDVLKTVLKAENYNVGALMKKVMSNPELRKHGKEVNTYIQQLVKEHPTEREEFDEFSVLKENTEYLSLEFDCEIEVYQAADSDKYDPQGKARFAVPFRPGIYIE